MLRVETKGYKGYKWWGRRKWNNYALTQKLFKPSHGWSHVPVPGVATGVWLKKKILHLHPHHHPHPAFSSPPGWCFNTPSISPVPSLSCPLPPHVSWVPSLLFGVWVQFFLSGNIVILHCQGCIFHWIFRQRQNLILISCEGECMEGYWRNLISGTLLWVQLFSMHMWDLNFHQKFILLSLISAAF